MSIPKALIGHVSTGLLFYVKRLSPPCPVDVGLAAAMSPPFIATAFFCSATMRISVNVELERVVKSLQGFQRDQLPFAMAKTLTDTAREVKDKLTEALPRQLDKPTPFTMRAFGFTPATKQSLEATVFIRPDQFKYLQFQIDGGVRRSQKRAIVIPKDVALNEFGNMPRREIKKMLAKKAVFSGTVDGVPGIYMRKKFGHGVGLKLLAAYADQVKYRKRFPFYEIARNTIPKSFEKNFKLAYENALATMR